MINSYLEVTNRNQTNQYLRSRSKIKISRPIIMRHDFLKLTETKIIKENSSTLILMSKVEPPQAPQYTSNNQYSSKTSTITTPKFAIITSIPLNSLIKIPNTRIIKTSSNTILTFLKIKLLISPNLMSFLMI